MSFVTLTNTKGERMLINLDFVMHITDSRKGVVVEFHDGLTFLFDVDFALVSDELAKSQQKV